MQVCIFEVEFTNLLIIVVQMGKVKQNALVGITRYSHRQYMYSPTGFVTSLILREQSGMGSGTTIAGERFRRMWVAGAAQAGTGAVVHGTSTEVDAGGSGGQGGLGDASGSIPGGGSEHAATGHPPGGRNGENSGTIGTAPRAGGSQGGADEAEDTRCEVCNDHRDSTSMLLCDACPAAYHLQCLTPALEAIPDGDWKCPPCSGQAPATAVQPVGGGVPPCLPPNILPGRSGVKQI